MREVSFERAVRGEPARVLQRAEQGLVPLGYEVAARSAFELSLVGAGPGGRHRLTVRADGQVVRFVFAPGSPGVSLPEQGELERRVEVALGAVGSVSSGAERRCSICATVLAAGEKHCPICGMAN